MVDDIFDRETNEFYHHYQIVNIENTEHQLKGLEFVFVELPKFKPQNVQDKRLMVLWLRYLTEIKDGTTEISAELTQDTELKQAIDCLQESAFSKEELEYYDKNWDQVRVERSAIEDALELGEKVGWLRGREEGREEGEQLGIRKEKLSIARNMKSMGISIVEISKITGLDGKEIELL